MLYISTRFDNDVYTAHKTLVGDRAGNGGCYVPFRMPAFKAEEISGLLNKNFNQVVSEILNLFFSARLTELDIGFAVSKNPCVIHTMSHRIAVAELWHNPGRACAFLTEKLYEKIRNHAECPDVPSEWAKIVIDLAIIFGIYAEALNSNVICLNQEFDISLDTDHFTAICAAWYARKMGIPIGTIICTEKDNGTVWDLVQRGTFSTSHATPGALSTVERLVFDTLGASAVREFVDCVEKRCTYTISDEDISIFNAGLFCSVAGEDRAATVINSVLRSNSYNIDSEAALCYGGLQDYRAKNGEGRLTILLSRHAPMSNL